MKRKQEQQGISSFLPSNPFFLYVSFVSFLPLADFFFVPLLLSAPLSNFHTLFMGQTHFEAHWMLGLSPAWCNHQFKPHKLITQLRRW